MPDLLRTDRQGVHHYYNTDTLELLQANKLTQSSDWPYHSKGVTYTFNSQGYRTWEFDRIDWSRSVIIFGCSITLGVGLTDDATISSQLARIVTRPIINLGIAGGSPMHMWALTTQLSQQGITPKACVYLWPGVNRLVQFHGDRYHSTLGPWDTSRLGPWAHENQGEEYFKLAKASVSQQWPIGTRVCHWTWSEYVYRLEGVKFSGALPVRTDYARDLVHPGADTAQAWAQTISKGL